MPIRKKIVKSLRRRPRKGVTMGRRKFKKSFSTDPKGMIGFPKQRVVKMRWMENLTLDSTGPAVTRTYAANDINNVFALPVHRPLGYDQWGEFYQEWVVVGSRIHCKATYASTTAGSVPVNWGVLLTNDGSTTFAQLSALVEQGKTKYKIMQPVNNGNMTSISQSFSAKKFFNITNVKDNYRRLGSYFAPGAGAGGPELNASFVVWAAAADNGTNVQPINVTVTIEYLVLVGSQKTIAQSAIPS